MTRSAAAATSTPREVSPGARRATMRSPSINTSIGLAPLAEMTVPPLTRMVTAELRSGLDEVAVGLRATVAVKGPAVADLGEEIQVEIPHDDVGGVIVTELADELAFRINEIAI